MSMFWRIWCVIACGVLVLGIAHAIEEPLLIAPGGNRVVTLTAQGGERVLALEGRYVALHEKGHVFSARLTLNGTVLDDSRIIGRTTFLYPTHPAVVFWPIPRYHAETRGFAFVADVDYTVCNGPFVSESEEVRKRIYGCPPLLQLNVDDLLKPGANELRIDNTHEKISLEIRRAACAAEANVVEEELIIPPAWLVILASEEMRDTYVELLDGDTLQPADRMETMAAIGIADSLRPGGDPSKGYALLRKALEPDIAFGYRTEAAYRLLALRMNTGRWFDDKTESLVRKIVTSVNDSWSEAARTLLALLDHIPETRPGRLIVRPNSIAGSLRVDGRLKDRCWQGAQVYPANIAMGESTTLSPYQTDVRFAVFDQGLAVAFTGELPEDPVWSTKKGVPDAPVWQDNCVELFISPNVNLESYIELDVTPQGARFDAQVLWGRRGNIAWNGKWKHAARQKGSSFVVEYFVPWSDLGLAARPAPGSIFVVSAARFLTRERKDPGAFYAFTKLREVNCHRLEDGAFVIMP